MGWTGVAGAVGETLQLVTMLPFFSTSQALQVCTNCGYNEPHIPVVCNRHLTLLLYVVCCATMSGQEPVLPPMPSMQWRQDWPVDIDPWSLSTEVLEVYC